jgi:hypothetical protein
VFTNLLLQSSALSPTRKAQGSKTFPSLFYKTQTSAIPHPPQPQLVLESFETLFTAKKKKKKTTYVIARKSILSTDEQQQQQRDTQKKKFK